MSIENNINKINKKINLISNNAKLCCVTKYSDIQKIKEAIKAGVKIIGESRVQDAKEKFTLLQFDILQNNVEKHMIGHLQTNKVRLAVQLFDVIQSVDSIELAEFINKECKSFNKIQDIYLQINISKETQKYGFSPTTIKSSYNKIKQLNNLNVIGIMAMAKNTDNEKEIRLSFKKVKEIADKLNLKEISMGMSNDYKIALEEGATLIRIGSAIFKE